MIIGKGRNLIIDVTTGAIGNGVSEIIKCDQVSVGRYVTIYKLDAGKLTLCEVQIFVDG